jgi:3-sulfinopropanoyl-CoA desulfinase
MTTVLTQQDLYDTAKELALEFSGTAHQWDQRREYCWRNVEVMSDAGLMGMTIPREFGGQGASFLDVLKVIECVARECALSARILVESNMGGISAIMAYGTKKQKEFCAPIVINGDKPAICITEPLAGSAATEMSTTAKKQGNRFILNGHKHWITGGGVSKLYLVFAKVLDENDNYLGIGGFLIHRDLNKGINPKGFVVGKRERTMGLCGMPETELLFDKVEIEEDFVLAPRSGYRKGFAELMMAYNTQRVGAGTIAMGIAAGATHRAKQYLCERKQFGRPLAEFQGLQWMLAEMDADVHASRLMLHDAAQSSITSSSGFPDMMSAARAKFFATERAIKVVNDALQMFGARGFGSNEPLERMYRDVRMFTIGGGTAQILKTQVAGHLLGMPTPQVRNGYAQSD